ncbi:ribonuclease HII [Robiginitalea biformata]|uniref:Ribonuclease HII n=1 Tax=Robiginitalea biformata (strain ATCC BAA-864 / DSM 15991 / KCTC 12146 / HTCC2501) TaxID=313596 RepID=A4CJI2_ROBBH|nr:ribonuclease HII [Robiginitalea biformata]EAR17090.1 ribonuclease HII [Robiginitalea biformata HTCC2501]
MLEAYYSCALEAGTDEAGRGCLAGPVTAAAVILPERFEDPLLNDSKKLSADQRERLAPKILREALATGVAHIPPATIDEINILQASLQAMHRALDQLGMRPEAIAVDGNRFLPYEGIPYQCLVRGDGRYLNIAAASVLAKTARDARMRELHREYPQYGWDRNKGYPTQEHREALRKHGPSPYHRQSFRLLPEQLKFRF